MIANPVIITKRNTDSEGNPVSVYIIESKQIFAKESVIVLKQVPDEVYKVKIQGYKEVFDRDDLKQHEFKVDYVQGVVYFHPKAVGKTVVVEYYGIGYELISCSRIYTKYDKHGNALETLEELIGNATEQLELIKTLGNSVDIIAKLETSVQNGNSISNSISDKIVEVNNASTTCVNNVNTVIQKAKDEVINVSGNKEFLVLSSEWVLNGDVYEKQLTHTLNSENLHVTTKDRDTKDAVMIGYKILDKSNILLKSDEAINMSVILSASYYHAVQTISDNVAEEVIRARKSESSLDNKIGKIDESIVSINEDLDTKTNKSETYLKSEGININDFDEETRKIFLEQQGIDVNYVLGDGNVTPNNTTFVEKMPLNMFDKDSAQIGKFINSNNGVEVENSNYCCSDFIKIRPGKELKLTEYIDGAWYDKDKIYIKGEANGSDYARVAPENAVYYRASFSLSYIDIAMVAEKDYFEETYSPYGVYEFKIKDDYFVNKIKEISRVDKITPNDTNFVKEYRVNTFNKDTIVNGIVSSTTGQIVPNDSYIASDFIEVVPNETIKTTLAWGTAFYDSNKTFISGEESQDGKEKTLTIPSNCKYMRITFSLSAKETSMVCRNNLPNRYYSYNEYIFSFSDIKKESDIVNAIINNPLFENKIKNKSNLYNKTWCVIGDSITEKNFRASKNYHDYISENTGCTIINMGKSGTGYLQTYDTSENICDRISLLPTDIDYITVFAGTNDTDKTLGVYGDKTKDTLYGAIDYVCNNLISKYPLKKIALFTPLQTNEAQGETNKRYLISKAIKQVAKDYAIPVLDLNSCSGLRPWNTDNNKEFFSCASAPEGDGLHPNDKGQLWISNIIQKFMETL